MAVFVAEPCAAISSEKKSNPTIEHTPNARGATAAWIAYFRRLGKHAQYPNASNERKTKGAA